MSDQPCGRDSGTESPPPSTRSASPGSSPDDSIDPDRFRITEEQTAAPDATRVSQPHLRGPIPLNWLTRAAQQPGKSLHVAIALWFVSGVTSSRCVPLSNVNGLRFGLDRNAKYRGLVCLEAAGLVTVERKLGRAPMVTILDAEPEP